jgi:hypothetical protein
MDLSESDTSVDSSSSEDVNVYELINRKYERTLACKTAEIKDLQDQLQDRQNMTRTLEEENQLLIESLKSTSGSLLKYDKDLQDIRKKAGEEVKKVMRDKSSILQESQENEQRSQEMITKLKESEKKDREMIVKLEESQQKLAEELSKIKDDKDQEMIAKVEEAKKKFGEEMSKMREEKDKEMFTKLKETKERITKLKESEKKDREMI